jgi:hypothetical protein
VGLFVLDADRLRRLPGLMPWLEANYQRIPWERPTKTWIFFRPA